MATDANATLQASITEGASFLAPPAAPTLSTAATGGTVADGYYIVEVSYVDAQGETTPSAPSAIKCGSSGTNTLTIASPSASGSATGWYAYVTQVNGSSFTRQQTAGSPTAIGTNLTLTAPPTNTGAAPQVINGTGVYTSTALDLITGTPRRGLKARVIFSAASNASGSNTVAWTIEHSDDNTTFYLLSANAENNITLSTTAQSGEKFISFETSKRYVRSKRSIGGLGSTPTVTSQMDIVQSRP